MRGKKPVFFNLAVTTAAPVFMYMYIMHVLPTLLLSLPADHPHYETLKDYLGHVRDYVRLFLQGGFPKLRLKSWIIYESWWRTLQLGKM